MTLTHKDDLHVDILKMYLRTRKKFLGQGFQKLQHEEYRQTHLRMTISG